MAIATSMPRRRHRCTGITRASSPWSRPFGRSSVLRAELPYRGVPVPGLAREIRVKIASSRAEWEQAFELVADSYQARGYEGSDSADYRFTSYHALPDTVVLVVKDAERVVATLSLFPDNTLLGMPAEAVYQAEIRQLRQAGYRLFEGGCLADRDLSVREGLHAVRALIRLAWHCQLAQGATMNVITVNPRHRDYYTKLYGYIPLGPQRPCSAVRGHPAEAFYLSPPLMKARAPMRYQEIFETPLPRSALVVPRIPAGVVRHLGSHSSQTNRRFVEKILKYVDEYGSPRAW
jgi:hypothetical protein